MSSTFVADTTDDHKSDNTLIIIVNNDGTVSVDQETLQNLIANQQNTAVSVVRVGASTQGDDSSQDSNGTCDSQNDGNPHVNLTVEGFYPPPTTQSSTTEGANENLVDPFLEMDPEQLERLETALQSEQAKQILGENVTAMLDMLSVEEEKAQITDSIRMDHCYTNLSPSSAPTTSSTPNHQYGPVGSSDTDTSDNSFEQEPVPQPVVTSSTPVQQPARTRGRGRGPGRPRKDVSAVRSTQSYRGTARGTGRGVARTTRGGQTGTSVAPGMVMVQQIKPINPPLAPPPSSPSSASLVPLIKPLVMTDRHGHQITTALTSTTPGQVTVQKQVVTVPGGTRLVTLTGTKLGQVVTGGQQRVVITTNRTLQQQQSLQQRIQQQKPKQKQQIPTTVGQDTSVTTTSTEENQLPAQQDLGNMSSSVIPGMTVPPGQAKVLVAKMPTIPPQLLGAQPSSGLTEALGEDRLQDSESGFAHFGARDEENEDLDASEEESDEDMDADDEEYVGPGGSARRRGRFGAKYRGGRRMTRGARTRGTGRQWDRGGARGLGKVGVKRRGGRGRGISGRAEDMERVKRLEAEMAAALAAMDHSPTKEMLRKSIGNEKVTLDRLDLSKIAEKQEIQLNNSDQDLVSSFAKKKVVKVYGKSNLKRKLVMNKEVEETVSEVIENKKSPEKVTTPPTPEKKTPPLKSPIKKHSTELPQTPAATPPSTPTSTEASKIDNRKNYPKRENRKPPAHLAEALGPALFSTPDIIRRVSTGSEQKATPTTPETPTTPPESKKSSPATVDEVPAVSQSEPVPAAEEPQTPALTEPEPALPDDLGNDLQVPEDQGLLDTLHVEATKTEEELLADTLLLQQHINDDVTAMETDNTDVSKPADVVSKPEEPISSTDAEVLSPPEIVSESPPVKTEKVPLPTQTTVTRSTRRRNSNLQEIQAKKEVTKTPVQKQQQQSQVKERRKSEDSKSIQSKGRTRSRSSEIDIKDQEDEDEAEDEDSEAESSDDESWNSEDDPDRLWCICKKPHNNRFMICCDSCEDWFHGKCVGVTKSIGQQMEENGLEWCCPNCTKKKEAEGKEKERESKKQNKVVKEKEVKKAIPKDTPNKDIQKEIQKDVKEPSSTEETAAPPVQKQQASSSSDGIMYCIVCKKEARPTSIYCSDTCILKHAQESLSLINKEKPSAPSSSLSVTAQNARNQTQALPSRVQNDQQVRPEQSTASPQTPPASVQLPRAKPDARVIVFERKSGRLLAGANAPTAGNLKTWLKDNPTFEVVRPGVMPTTKFYNQRSAAQLKPVQNTKSIPMQSKLVAVHPKSLTQSKPVVIQSKPVSSSKLPTSPSKIQKPGVSSLTATVAKDATLKSAIKIGQGVKSQTGTPKPVVKSSGNTTNPVQGGKPPSGPAVSKAPATSTVKENTSNKSQIPVVTKKVEVKRSSSTSSTETPKKEEEKPAGPEPIRINVRKTLQELLQTRIQECSDLTVAEEEVQKIALNIEEEMHTYFRDTGIKYKSKYRSLVFNIKDPKNLTLFRKIADKSVTPHQLVRLSPEELASQELAQWREREAKHQLEMIRKNELDLMALSKTYVMKTHKGEQVIEADESLKTDVPELVDPSSVPDLVSALNNSVSSTVEDTSLEQDRGKIKEKGKESKDKEKRREDRDRSSKDREKSSKREDKKKDSRDRERSKDKDGSRHESRHDSNRSDRVRKRSGDRGKSNSRNKRHHHHHSSSDRDRDRSSKKERRDEELKKEEIRVKKEDVKKIIKEESKVTVDSRIEDDNKNEIKAEIESKIKSDSLPDIKVEEDSDLSDREPSSTVTIKTPDINNIDDGSSMGAGACATVWKGFVNMPDVAKFFTTVQVVSGDSQNLCKDLPDTVDIVGRIIPETVWDYISKMKKSGTKEILVIRLTAANDEEKIPYITLYTYLNIRNRLGVVGNVSKMIKDFYIMPLASHNPVPQVLLPLDGPGFEDYRPHLLLGILVRARRKRLAPELTYVAKVPKRPPPLPAVLETPERSYTPPLPGTGDDIGSLTPPHPPPNVTVSECYTPPPHSPKQSSFGTSKYRTNIDPRLMRKPGPEVEQETCIADKEEDDDDLPLPDKITPSSTPKFNMNSMDDEDDDDAPYSPGGGMDEDNGESSEDNLLSTPKNSSDLQRKMEELNRKIEEQKQQIQNISSAIGTDSVGASSAGVTGVESLQVSSIMQSYIIGTGEETHAPVSTDAEDENEAYSPSRSFTPPTSDSIPFIGVPSDPTTSVLSSIPSNISLPSNLSEILASIKKRESDGSSLSVGTGKGINLKEDPIVQNYTSGRSSADLETKTESDDLAYIPQEDEASVPNLESYSPNSTTASQSSTSTAQASSLLNSASSIVPALLSLSTPVVHSPVAKTEVSLVRDPRQKQTEATKSASTLSSLSDDDLIKKAMEMELATAAAEKQSALTNPTLQQPLPPGVDSFPSAATAAALPPPPPPPPPPLPPMKPSSTSIKSLPSGQPLPPGLEDEEYPTYSSSYAPPPPPPPLPQSSAPPHTLQPPQIAPPPQNVNYSVRHPNPVPFHMPPHHYNPPPPPPPSAYNIGPPQGSSYSAPYVSAPPMLYGGSTAKTAPKPMEDSRNKRKFQDMDEDIPSSERRESSKSGQGREPWDKKVPVPVRGRYTPRGGIRGGGSRFGGRGGGPHSQRGYLRPRGGRNGPPHRTRWGPPNSDEDMGKKQSSRYDASIRSEWDSHIKEFEEKQRERTRELKHRERERERDRPSSRSYSSSRSSKCRNSDIGSDDSS
ncbi:death-inducer obliterator 1 isoform X2 [Periplaneta americana]|uniref:death-inducer obliterator 1 isoform X2 n=1 Tax=Periplaneta americana TaxID=6978 RepID=UPI0037E94F8D